MEDPIKTFPYKYVGGGYFRLKGVLKNVTAPILHGEDILREFLAHLEKEKSKENLTLAG